ncbi:pseudouridine synthase [Nonlabens marinus]|uniref:Pseudouridine synthase n=1 Tax=Nonlabens marinus S1-08 TaxID=1454201 RepID=W8W0K0_9FLAO|nr:pseudouridine synthase [Nonlabens marinus]BAO56461.1 tRNA pseudouridine synthase A [Nonlabens marinus S1-08]
MEHQHFLIYKPYKMVSQFVTNDRHQKRKRFLGELADFPEGVMAVGRLDETSEGLLLITTDGKLSHQVNNSGKFNKEYYAQVDGSITEEAILTLRQGVDISVNGKTYRTKPCEVKQLVNIPKLPQTDQKIRDDRHGPTSWISIVLNEGKFRQVRKMTSAVGYPTLRLARARIGNYSFEGMKCGEIIRLKARLENISS